MSAKSGIEARLAAYELLRGTLARGRTLDEQLAESAAVARLPARDRAFARNLVATTLRRLGQADALIEHCLERPLPASGGGARDVLRLGVTQLLFLEIPPHAAVDQSVELVERAGFRKFKGLVNAVLRRLASEGSRLIEKQDAAWLNTPDWLWKSWRAAYGELTTRAIAAAHLEEPPLDLTVRDGAELWAERLDAEILPTGTLRREAGGPVTDLPGYEEGAWWVQDAAAALSAKLMGEVRGRSIIDLCAAPGGKTAQLAAAGAMVTAVDRSAVRLKRVEENLARLRLQAATVAADGAIWRPEKPADGVLIDAPCSATGTIRRHPDIAWLKTPRDVERLAAVQDDLLAAGIEMLRPGGTLVFCTCSLQPEEGAERIEMLFASGAPVERDPIRAEEVGGDAELLTEANDVRTLPCHWADKGGLDGFFIARLRRR